MIAQNLHLQKTSTEANEVDQYDDVFEKEIDMGYFEEYLNFGTSNCGQDGCKRINYCSCDCDHFCFLR